MKIEEGLEQGSVMMAIDSILRVIGHCSCRSSDNVNNMISEACTRQISNNKTQQVCLPVYSSFFRYHFNAYKYSYISFFFLSCFYIMLLQRDFSTFVPAPSTAEYVKRLVEQSSEWVVDLLSLARYYPKKSTSVSPLHSPTTHLPTENFSHSTADVQTAQVKRKIKTYYSKKQSSAISLATSDSEQWKRQQSPGHEMFAAQLHSGQ